MIPHERSLVAKYKDRPFALLGINTDSDKDAYHRQAKEMQVTWRSAWTGSTSNAISSAFKVTGYPTLFLIDDEGVIRNKWVGSPGDAALEKAIEDVVAEIEKKSKK